MSIAANRNRVERLHRWTTFSARATFATLVGAISASLSVPLLGDEVKPPTDFVAAAREEKSHADGSPNDFARNKLISALERLDDYLNENGSNGEAWRKYLRWETLRRQLGPNAELNLSLLNEVQQRFEGGYPGLELKWFADVNTALRSYIELAQGGTILSGKPKTLPDLVVAAKAIPPSVSTEAVESARKKLRAAVARLDAYLTENGANGDTWRKYLGWEMLQQQLDPQAELNLIGLEEVHRRFTGGYAGLELRWFADVTQALRPYIDVAQAAANRQLVTDYEAQLATVVSAAEAVSKQPQPDDLEKLGRAVGFLQSIDAAPRVVGSVREQFAQPNFFFQASSDFIRIGIEKDIDDTMPLRDYMMGTHITGTGHTIGRVSARLVPDDHRAVIETIMDGVTHSRTVGVHPPAIVHSRGQTTLWGRKVLMMDSNGLHSPSAEAKTCTTTQTLGIGTTKCGLVGAIVLRVAPRKVAQQKPQSEAVANQRAQQKFKLRLNEEAGKVVSEANGKYRDKIRQPLERFQAFPRLFQAFTTDEHLGLTLAHDLRDRLAAPTAPPELNGSPDLAVRVHESFVNNYMQSLLGGRKMRQEEIDAIFVNNFGEVPEKVKRDDEEDRGPWSITFPTRDPVTLRIDDNLLTLTVRGTRFTSEDKTYDAMNVTLRYRVRHTGKNVIAERQGDIEVIPPDFKPGETLNSRQTVLRNLLRKRFEKLLDPVIETEGLSFEGPWSKAGTLYARQWQADDGWMLMALERRSKTRAAQQSEAE